MRKELSAGAILISLSETAPALADVNVISSGGFTAAYRELVPTCEAKIGHKVNSAYGASMGARPMPFPIALLGESPLTSSFWQVMLSTNSLPRERAYPGTRTDLPRSAIGMSVKAGMPKPVISTVEALHKTLMAAKSIAYSASGSGTYLSEERFPKLDPSG